MADTPNQGRKFIRWFAVPAACFLALLLSLNVLADPYDVVGVRMIPPLVRSDRLVKTTLLAERDPAPQILVMGSSRTLKLDPGHIQQLTGMTALNLGVGSCRAEGPLLMTTYALKIDRAPEVIILGIDLEAFHDKLPVDQRWNRVPEARGVIQELNEDRYKILFNTLAELLSYDMALDSIRSVRRHRSANKPLQRTTYRDDGVIEYPLWQSWRDAGTFNLDAMLNDSRREYRGRFRGYESPAPWRQGYFQQFLQLCQDNDIAVVGFITPLHPRVVADLRVQADYDRLKEELWSFLAPLQERYPFDLHDLSDVATFGGTEENFWDGAHVDEINANRLLSYLATHSAGRFTPRRTGP